jgi:hypothetical protein
MTSELVIGIVAREAGDEIAPADLHLELALERQGGPDLDLDLLRGPLADHQVVLLADVGRDVLVELVAADPERGRDRRSRQGRSPRSRLVPPPMSMTMFPDGPLIGTFGADRGRQRLLDQVGLLRAGLQGRVTDARFSTEVTPAGTLIITSGREKPIRPFVALAMKKRSIASVMT